MFDFPKPFGAIEVNYNARFANRTCVHAYLNDEQEKNIVNFFLLDGKILAGLKIVGLHYEAVRLFQNTLKKQLKINYNRDQYFKYLEAIYNYSPYELFQMGKQFKK